MSKPIIEVINISKKFSIGQKSSDIRHSISNFLAFNHNKKPEIWALKDVSFEVQEGEVFGLIGPNGSGKSTLLKILSRITYPTSGKAILRGRVSSLLEVGTGFHNELTGRENIYLNGSILGMKRAEIRQKFDEIVDFSGIEQFIDTPVKHYSSGMYVRLAFSVAAHLEPEILLVDEVLSVGDLEFRQKSMGKMNEVAKQGRTVIFVSHNLDAIESMCSSGTYLERGILRTNSKISEVVNAYKNLNFIPESYVVEENVNEDFKIEEIIIYDSQNKNTNVFSSGEDIKIVLKIHSLFQLDRINLRIEFKDEDGRFLFVCNNYLSGTVFRLNIGNNAFECLLPKIPLNIGVYYLDFSIGHKGQIIHLKKNALKFEVIFGDFYNSGNLPPADKKILINFRWDENQNFL